MPDRFLARIVFTGDILRPAADAFASSRARNILWLSELLGRQVGVAIGKPVETVAWGSGSSPEATLGDSVVSRVYDEVGAPLSLKGWTALYDRAEPPAALDAIVERHFAGALVIGFELPPVFERALLRRGVPVIDIAIHPVGFLDDIFLAFRASEPALREAFARHAIREDFLRLMAGVQGATAWSKSHFTPEPDSLVIFGPSPDDASEVAGGQFVRLDAFREAVVRTTAAYAKVYYRRHPLASPDAAQANLRDWGIAAEATGESAYVLLAHPHVRGVMSFNSSVGIEAGYFDKAVHFLRGPPRGLALDGAVPDGSSYVGIAKGVLDPDFWREILAGVAPVTARDGLVVPEKPNRLRQSLRGFRGYGRIDGDGHTVGAMQDGAVPGERPVDLAADHDGALLLGAAELRRDLALIGARAAARVAALEHRTSQDDAMRAAQATALEQRVSQNEVSHAAAVAALDRQLAETRTVLAALQQRQGDEAIHRSRTLLGRMVFRPDGRPTRCLRRALFHSNGKRRGIFRSWLVGKDGMPRKLLRQWMTSADYLALPRAYLGPADADPPSVAPPPLAAWRSVAGAAELSEAELDVLMDRIRAEVRASRSAADS